MLIMSYQLIINLVRTYAPWIMLPVTITVGFIGYNMERWFRRPNYVEPPKSTEEKRQERLLKDIDVSNETRTRSN
jgi:hypothetical protein